MPNLTISILVMGVVFIVVVVALFVWVVRRSNKVNLIEPTNEKPEWMRNTPPKETMTATLADGEGIQVFDYDKGEGIASPFAEQIEDILQARLDGDPDLQKYKVDLGTRSDGLLEIDINGTKYTGIDEIPDEKLKVLFKEAVEAWKKS